MMLYLVLVKLNALLSTAVLSVNSSKKGEEETERAIRMELDLWGFPGE